MIYEHDIPNGSKLYFASLARLKREIESVSSQVLYANDFEEIVTPYLSYHQHSFIDEKELLRISDIDNNILALRADSTLDAVRIVTKRLGRSTEQKKWFYIQPVFRYPGKEIYQIGGEMIGQSELKNALVLVGKILKKLDIKSTLQISHIQIPKILSSMLGVSLDVFASGNLETLLAQKQPWLNALITLQEVKEIDSVISVVPNELKTPLEQMKKLALAYDSSDVVLAPLFYAKMRYYDELFFRFFHKNFTISAGGCYEFEGTHSSGFALYTDNMINYLTKRVDG